MAWKQLLTKKYETYQLLTERLVIQAQPRMGSPFPAHASKVGTRWSVRCLWAQTVIWLYTRVIKEPLVSHKGMNNDFEHILRTLLCLREGLGRSICRAAVSCGGIWWAALLHLPWGSYCLLGRGVRLGTSARSWHRAKGCAQLDMDQVSRRQAFSIFW